jgi:hypothetical protein
LDHRKQVYPRPFAAYPETMRTGRQVCRLRHQFAPGNIEQGELRHTTHGLKDHLRTTCKWIGQACIAKPAETASLTSVEPSTNTLSGK